MRISIDQQNTEGTIFLAGELDHHAAQEILPKLFQEIDRRLLQRVELNFRGVSFMDSSGIAVVLRTQRYIQKIGGSFSIAELSPQSARILETAGIGKMVTIRKDESK